MLSDTVEAVDPHRAHRARARLLLAVHEVISDHRAIGSAEQLAEADGSRWRVTGVEIDWSFVEDVVLDGCSWRQRAPQRRDALAVPHEIDLGETQLLATAAVLVRFIGQASLLECAVNRFGCHVSTLKWVSDDVKFFNGPAG